MAKGSKKRAKRTAAAFDHLITAVEKVIGNDDSKAVEFSSNIKENFQLSLLEQRTLQQIEESKHRITTDAELMKLVERKVIEGNFVRIHEVRDVIRLRLVGLQFPFIDQFLDAILPVPANKGYVDSILDTYDRLQAETEGDQD